MILGQHWSVRPWNPIRANPEIGSWKVNDLRVSTFLFSVICDRAIRRAWTGAGHGDPDGPGGAGIAIGDLHAQPFVARGKDLDRGGPQRLPQGCEAPARKTSDIFDAFLFQCSNHCLCSTHNTPSSD